MKKVCSRCLKNHFSLTFNNMESYHPEYLLVYYKLLKKFKSFACVFNFRYRFIARPPVLLQNNFSIDNLDNSARRLLLLKIVLHSLFANAIDGLRPHSAYADRFNWYAVVAFA